MKSFWESNESAIERLKKEYELHRNLVIGYDFDNTIYDYRKQGLDLKPVITLLKQCTNLGFTMCLWTVPTETLEGMATIDKVAYCEGLGIRVDYVNSSPLFKESKQKAFFSILLDDRAGLYSAYYTLRTALLELKLIL